MKQLYHAFEVESQKPGKVFHELAQRRRRELGVPIPPEEQVLPLPLAALSPSASPPAIDIAIDREFDEVDASPPSTLARTLAILQTEQWLEDLEATLEGTPQVVERHRRTHRRVIERAMQQELPLLEEIHRSATGPQEVEGR